MLNVFIGIKEQDVFIDNYSKIVDVLKLSFKNMKPHFISERIIDIEEKSKITAEDLLDKIMTHIKDGNTDPFYTMLNIIKSHGNAFGEELAAVVKESLSLKQ